uniref:Uncharacterized protein n=1 Tax=Pinctada fucata TaxID=50426 RepID=A0A194ANM4_PINFU
MMKFALIILLILPLVFSAPKERFIEGFSLHSIEQQISHLITPEQTEAGCETGCKALISGLGTILCPSACSTLLHTLHLDGSSS